MNIKKSKADKLYSMPKTPEEVVDSMEDLQKVQDSRLPKLPRLKISLYLSFAYLILFFLLERMGGLFYFTDSAAGVSSISIVFILGLLVTFVWYRALSFARDIFYDFGQLSLLFSVTAVAMCVALTATAISMDFLRSFGPIIFTSSLAYGVLIYIICLVFLRTK